MSFFFLFGNSLPFCCFASETLHFLKKTMGSRDGSGRRHVGEMSFAALRSTSMFVGTDNSPQLSESMYTWNL